MNPNPINTVESEVTIYAKIGNFDGFKEADSVSNIQELITFIEGRGKYRMRKVTDSTGVNYISGIKTIGKGDTVKQALDEECPVTAAMFEAARHLADHLTVRDRFVFQGEAVQLIIGDKTVVVPPIQFQVDLFSRFDGFQGDMAKIDIEVAEIRKAIALMGEDPERGELVISLKNLPIKPINAFMGSSDNTSEEREVIKKLWEDYRQNPFGGPVKEITSVIDQGAQQGGQKPPQ